MKFAVTILMVFLGSALGTPFERVFSDEDARIERMRTLLDNPNDNSPGDVVIAVNQESDIASSLFEGDVKLSPSDVVDTSTTDDKNAAMNAKRAASKWSRERIWVGRTIHYTIDALLVGEATTNIKAAIAQFTEKTCINWVERPEGSTGYYVKFMKENGCYSFIGKTNDNQGFQVISIGTGCTGVGIIIHEMMHCIGFWHEQARPDRNSKVEILWENIVGGMESQFNKQAQANIDAQGTPYDKDSDMQYGNFAFSRNGKKTLQDISNPSYIFGQRQGFSPNDLLAINKLYSCSVTNGGWSDWSTYSPCDDKCIRHRVKFCTNPVITQCDSTKTDGLFTETSTCTPELCYAPQPGHWGRWSAWSACSKTCDEGTYTRTRVCDDPAPKNQGADCVGSSSHTGACKIKSCNSGPGDCEFDDPGRPFCDWEQDTTDSGVLYRFPDWLNGLATISSSTGPQAGDHTTGSGKFAYAEASGCNKFRGVVRLQSVKFPATARRCITFWYYAYGYSVNQLNVIIRINPDLPVETKLTLFSITGNQGANWIKVKKEIVQPSAEYKVVYEMKCGADFRGDIALDDVKFSDGACPA